MIYKWSVRIALLNKTYWSQAKDETFNPPLVNRADMYFCEKRACVRAILCTLFLFILLQNKLSSSILSIHTHVLYTFLCNIYSIEWW